MFFGEANMLTSSRYILCLLLTILISVNGCVIPSAPNKWLPSFEETQMQAYGGWIEVTHSSDVSQAASSSAKGELIALSVDTVYILAETLQAIPKTQITKARLVIYDSKADELGVWTAVGALSTLTHGYGMALTLPIWITGGSIASSIQSHKPVIDYPEDYLPETFPAADLILSFAEHKGVAELLPDIAEMTGAKSVLVAVDNETWLPTGLARQLHGWLKRMNVNCVTPKPLCALTESDYGISRKERVSYDDELIAEFARYFGQPVMDIRVDPETRVISAAEIVRDAVCGCARYVAEGLIGVPVDQAE